MHTSMLPVRCALIGVLSVHPALRSNLLAAAGAAEVSSRQETIEATEIPKQSTGGEGKTTAPTAVADVSDAADDQSQDRDGAPEAVAEPQRSDPPEVVAPAEPQSDAASDRSSLHDAGRKIIAARLIQLGSTHKEAVAAAGALTEADLVVLLGNPEMLQPAGDMDTVTAAMIIGGLIIAGLIVLLVASEGSFVQG